MEGAWGRVQNLTRYTAGSSYNGQRNRVSLLIPGQLMKVLYSEAVTRRYSVKRVFLKRKLWYKCFLVNFAKFGGISSINV